MDSLTQIVLGAAVGEAVLGKKVGNRAMLWGAIGGTIPDLDVFVRYFTDEISAALLHRGFSHSILFCVLFAPILGWLVHKLYKSREASQANWSWMFFWVLITHPLLDAHTLWGTQLFWPFEYRVTYKNIFVIDPLYTLPFLFFVIAALFHKVSNPRRRKLNNLGLYISTGYMVLTLIFKLIAFKSFERQLDEQGISYNELDTRPAPLNTILWNAHVETENGYRVAYYSLLDQSDILFSKEFFKNDYLLDGIREQKVIQQLIQISDGWYFVEEQEDCLIFTDLRFGQIGVDPNDSPFLWRFELRQDEHGKVSCKRLSGYIENTDYKEVLGGLWERIKGV